MMFGWLFAAGPERRLLAEEGRGGPTLYVIAIMTFAMMVVAAAGLALSNAAGVVARGVENRYAIQLPSGSETLPAALAAARAAPGVLRAEPVPEAEMRLTLERWIGPAGLGEDLPVPALVTLDLSPGADFAAIRLAVTRAAPEARFVAHRESLGPLLRSLNVLRWLSLSLVLLMAVATSAAVILAARGALDTHRATIDVMHGIGATDEQVTRLFQRKIALDAVAGGAAGAAAATIVLLVLGSGGGALAGDLAGGPPLNRTDIVILALLPMAAVLLATVIARVAVLAALRRAL